MFKGHKAKVSETKEKCLAQDQPVQDFLQIWQAMVAETVDRIRLGKLELRVDKAWAALTQEHKDAAWMIVFPDMRKIKDIFGAHAVNLRS